MDFDIYNFPASIHRRAKEIVQKKESPFKEWSAALRKVAGIWIIPAPPFLPLFVAPPATFIISR
jgi:hypothetical protein